MMPWWGRLKFDQYIQGKRHIYGTKLYVLTESNGFTLKMKVYTESDDDTSGQGHIQKVLLVLGLLQEKLLQ